MTPPPAARAVPARALALTLALTLLAAAPAQAQDISISPVWLTFDQRSAEHEFQAENCPSVLCFETGLRPEILCPRSVEPYARCLEALCEPRPRTLDGPAQPKGGQGGHARGKPATNVRAEASRIGRDSPA